MKSNTHPLPQPIYWIILLGWICFCGCATGKINKDSFYFIQMSDPQFGMFNDNKSFEKETEHFTRAIQQANRLKPAFVVVTGDLVNRPFDTAQVAEYKRIAQQLNPGIPLYNVPGNHDVGNTPFPAGIATYRKEFGKDYYTFTYASMLGIVLNSVYLHSPQNVPQQAKEQEEWLIHTLQAAKGKKYSHIFVFLHHPLFLHQDNEPDEYFNIPLATRKKYLDLFTANGVRYIFAGHYHRNSFGKNEHIQVITTGPVGKPLGNASSGFRVIVVQGNKVRHPYYNLDSIPLEIKR